MLERLISETKDRHSKQPISQAAYDKWRHSTVTKRLFEELELSVIDSFQDYLTSNLTPAEVPQYVGFREGAAQTVEKILDWVPAGVEGPNDED